MCFARMPDTALFQYPCDVQASLNDQRETKIHPVPSIQEMKISVHFSERFISKVGENILSTDT